MRPAVRVRHDVDLEGRVAVVAPDLLDQRVQLRDAAHVVAAPVVQQHVVLLAARGGRLPGNARRVAAGVRERADDGAVEIIPGGAVEDRVGLDAVLARLQRVRVDVEREVAELGERELGNPARPDLLAVAAAQLGAEHAVHQDHRRLLRAAHAGRVQALEVRPHRLLRAAREQRAAEGQNIEFTPSDH
jgi:hypothetical protein